MPGSKVQQLTLQTTVPIVCSIALGLIFFQGEIVQRHYPAFQFVWSGVVISVFYYLLLYVRPRDAVLGLLLLFFLTLLTTGSTQVAFIVRDIFYVGGMGATVFVYSRYFQQGSHLSYAYPGFTLAGIYGIISIASSQIDIWIMRYFAIEHMGGNTALAVARTNGFFGVLIGFAVGCGIALNERLFNPKKIGTVAA